ncbi:MAG: hypothetical protein AAGF23_00425, partial [Acidobacteriota bacterium]
RAAYRAGSWSSGSSPCWRIGAGRSPPASEDRHDPVRATAAAFAERIRALEDADELESICDQAPVASSVDEVEALIDPADGVS